MTWSVLKTPHSLGEINFSGVESSLWWPTDGDCRWNGLWVSSLREHFYSWLSAFISPSILYFLLGSTHCVRSWTFLPWGIQLCRQVVGSTGLPPPQEAVTWQGTAEWQHQHWLSVCCLSQCSWQVLVHPRYPLSANHKYKVILQPRGSEEREAFLRAPNFSTLFLLFSIWASCQSFHCHTSGSTGSHHTPGRHPSACHQGPGWQLLLSCRLA